MNDEEIKYLLNKLKKYLVDYSEYFTKSEEQVKMQIINPILTSIGWQVENPEEVAFENSIEILKGRADYALFINKKPVIIIEAKKQGKISPEDFNQVVSYAAPKGIPFGICSSGSEWFFVRSSTDDEKEREIWKFDLLKDGIYTIIYKLNTIRKTEEFPNDFILETEKKIENLKDMEEELLKRWKLILKDKETFKKVIAPKFNDLLEQEIDDSIISEFLDKQIEAFQEQIKAYHPEKEKLGDKDFMIDGKIFKFKNVSDILEEVAKWLVKEKKIEKTSLPIGKGGRSEQNLLDNSEKNPKWGKNETINLGNNIYCLKVKTKKDAIKYSKILLDRFGLDEKFIINE